MLLDQIISNMIKKNLVFGYFIFALYLNSIHACARSY